jgi:hypothetical protein
MLMVWKFAAADCGGNLQKCVHVLLARISSLLMLPKLADDGGKLPRGCVSVLLANAPSSLFSHGAYELYVMAALRHVLVQNNLIAMERLFVLFFAFGFAGPRRPQGNWMHR